MRKLFLVCILIVMMTGLIGAQEIPVINEAPFLPVSPRVMGQGGSFIAVANGYDALFYNPAGFAQTSFSLTLASLSSWIYMNPAVIQDLVNSLPQDMGESAGTNDSIALLLNTINGQIGEGGIGVGLSAGAGLVAGGLGIGGALVIDSRLYGRDGMLDLTGDMTATLGFIAGYALNFNFLGMKWNVGADIRPMYRIHAIIENSLVGQAASDLLTGDVTAALGYLQNANALTGLGVGIDLGGILEMGPLQVGLSIRDLFGTKFEYYLNTVADIASALETKTDIPQTVKVTDTNYVIPMDISAGAALNIDIFRPLLGLVVHGDLQDVIGVIRDGRSPWTLLHIGAEASLLEFIKARIGFNQGYMTMGAGLRFLFIDLNVALFTRELGQFIKDQPNSGITVELAIRL